MINSALHYVSCLFLLLRIHGVGDCGDPPYKCVGELGRIDGDYSLFDVSLLNLNEFRLIRKCANELDEWPLSGE